MYNYFYIAEIKNVHI